MFKQAMHVAAVLVVVALTGCGKLPGAPEAGASKPKVQAARTPESIARRFFTEGYNKGATATADAIIAPGHVHHDPAVPGLPKGPDGIKGLWGAVRSAFPDIQYTITSATVSGDQVVLQWEAHGTQTGELFGFAPSGKEVNITGMHRFAVSNGLIQESWANWDALGLFKQIGASVAPAKAD